MKEAFRTTFVSSSCRYCDESYCITHSSMIRDRFFSVFFYVFDAFDFHLFSAHRRDKLTSLTFYTPSQPHSYPLPAQFEGGILSSNLFFDLEERDDSHYFFHLFFATKMKNYMKISAEGVEGKKYGKRTRKNN